MAAWSFWIFKHEEDKMLSSRLNSLKQLLLVLLISAFLFTAVASTQDNAIFLDQINSYERGYIPNWIEADVPIVFHIGTYAAENIFGVHGPFVIYSPDGATWQPIEANWAAETNWSALWDGAVTSVEFSATGENADSAYFAAFNIFGDGFLAGTTYIPWEITTLVNSTQIGKQLCLDSVDNMRGNYWLWSANDTKPDWSGPHCFTIEADCCQGLRADVNGDGRDVLLGNTLDLTYLVDFIFRGGPESPCSLEADLNGDGNSATIIDLTYFVDFKYRGGDYPASCP